MLFDDVGFHANNLARLCWLLEQATVIHRATLSGGTVSWRHGTKSLALASIFARGPRGDNAHPWCQAAALTGIFTVCCLTTADFSSVIFKTPLAKNVFAVLGSGSNGKVMERANLPNVRSWWQ